MALVKTYGNYVLFCLGVLTLLLVFVFQVHNRLDQTFRDSELTVRFSSEDSRHYVEMATAFHEGDWFEGIVERAHRQPLYPALLATAMAVGADSLRGLAVVNILVGGLTILLLLGIGRWVFARWWVGLIGALAYVSSEFIIGNIGGRLMTEPLYILVVTTTLAFALKYLETNRLAYLLGASAAAGLAYLTRPNGLFLFVAMWVTFLVHDLVRKKFVELFPGDTSKTSANDRAPSPQQPQILTRYLLPLAIFVIVATPSWAPRLIEFNDPVYHGYLPNYMWVDSYEEGHVGGAPRYTVWDYVASHDVGDVAYRVAYGIAFVFWGSTDDFGVSGILFYLLALTGVGLGLRSCRLKHIMLVVFMCFQSSPLVWTALSNGNGRVTYSALFPFLLFYVMILSTELYRRHYATSQLLQKRTV